MPTPADADRTVQVLRLYHMPAARWPKRAGRNEFGGAETLLLLCCPQVAKEQKEPPKIKAITGILVESGSLAQGNLSGMSVRDTRSVNVVCLDNNEQLIIAACDPAVY